ncbi:hypothetical protein AWENTII_007519 [Aspergillus wentii]
MARIRKPTSRSTGVKAHCFVTPNPARRSTTLRHIHRKPVKKYKPVGKQLTLETSDISNSHSEQDIPIKMTKNDEGFTQYEIERLSFLRYASDMAKDMKIDLDERALETLHAAAESFLEKRHAVAHIPPGHPDRLKILQPDIEIVRMVRALLGFENLEPEDKFH